MKRLNLVLFITITFIFIGSCGSEDQDSSNPTNGQENGDNPTPVLNCELSNLTDTNIYRITNRSHLFVFKQRHGNCETVEGSIEIIGLTGDFSTSEEFANLRHITGNLTLRNIDPSIDLGGLNNLRSIGGNLNYNSEVPINGELTSLESIGGDFIASDSPATEISGFPALENIGGSLIVEDNENLINLKAFASLKTCNDIIIADNDNLETIQGFDNIISVENKLVFHQNWKLNSLIGFENLETIQGEWLQINGNLALRNLPNFSKLNSVYGKIRIGVNNSNLDNAFPLLKTCGDLSITSATEFTKLDGFRALETINGSLVIETTADEITGFTSLQEINGDLSVINCDNLKNFNFAPNLALVTGYLDVSRCKALEEISGIGNLKTIGDYVSFQDNESLLAINGFSELVTIGGSMTIRDNSNLQQIDGFSNLQTVSSLLISYNFILETVSGFNSLIETEVISIGRANRLKNIVGFQNLESVTNYIAILGEPDFNIQSISAFQNLKQTGRIEIANTLIEDLSFLNSLTQLDWIELENNNGLLNLNGLSSVTGDMEYIQIVRNPLLVSIDALSNVSKANSITIDNNSSLSQCNLPSVCENIETTKNITIRSNNTGCFDIIEVEASCTN